MDNLTPDQAHLNVQRARQQYEDANLDLLRTRSRQGGEDARMARIARFNKISEQELTRSITDEDLRTDLGERSRYMVMRSLKKDQLPEFTKKARPTPAPIGECWECGKDIHSSREIRTSKLEKQGTFCDLDCENNFDYKTQNGTELEDDYVPSWDEYQEDSKRSDKSVARANYRDNAIKKQLAQKEARKRMWEDGQRAVREDGKSRVATATKVKPKGKK